MIVEGSRAWQELPFSRRVKRKRIHSMDIPKLSEECREKLWVVAEASLRRACIVKQEKKGEREYPRFYGRSFLAVRFRRTVAGEFWENYAAKCKDIARLHGRSPPGEVVFVEDWLRDAMWGKQTTFFNFHEEHLLQIDVLECMFRTPNMPKVLAKEIEEILDDTPYYIDYSVNPVSIELTALPANTTAAQRAIRLARNAGLTQAANHLQKSEKKIGANDYPGALDECGRALESIVQVIDPSTEKKSLGACLKSSKIKEIFKHPALHGAIGQLYGYLSDEAGVRHARGNEKSKVDRELAIFFYDVSAAFAEYLVSAHRKSKKPRKKKKK
ncbi:MAG: hypothetical protein MPK05_04100 [Gammaproteobacteria bacterium]|nr:hypothetical protein [Gammaproteobacteria bacterium]